MRLTIGTRLVTQDGDVTSWSVPTEWHSSSALALDVCGDSSPGRTDNVHIVTSACQRLGHWNSSGDFSGRFDLELCRQRRDEFPTTGGQGARAGFSGNTLDLMHEKGVERSPRADAARRSAAHGEQHSSAEDSPGVMRWNQ